MINNDDDMRLSQRFTLCVLSVFCSFKRLFISAKRMNYGELNFDVM